MLLCLTPENSEKLYGERRRGEGTETLTLDGGRATGVVDYDLSV